MVCADSREAEVATGARADARGRSRGRSRGDPFWKLAERRLQRETAAPSSDTANLNFSNNNEKPISIPLSCKNMG